VRHRRDQKLDTQPSTPCSRRAGSGITLLGSARAALSLAVAAAAFTCAGPHAKGRDDRAPPGARAATVPPAAPIKCAAADVLLVSIIAAPLEEGLRDASPSLKAAPKAPASVTVVATGPVLDHMHARDIAYRADCTADGIALEMTIVQWSKERGGALKNILWRPLVTAEVMLRRAAVHVKATWLMRLAGGAHLDHARTPPFPEQKYPATTTFVLPGAQTKKSDVTP
jgi:hypothetical protein